jgi:rhomboid protease GluP
MPIEGPALLAHSQRQAMDWALVLASQGILATIHAPEPGRTSWRLAVEPDETGRARSAIVAYRRENRGFRWLRPAPMIGLLFHQGTFAWAAALIFIHCRLFRPELAWLDGRAARRGEYWRLFTATALHADAGHLASNIALGIPLMGLAMGRFGAGPALLGTLVAGAAGNLLGLALRPFPYVGLGASGVVMGALGMIASQAAPLWRTGRFGARTALTGILAGSALFLITGADPGADLLAHTGGFLTGLGAGATCASIPPTRQGRVERLSLCAFAAVTAAAWAPVFTGARVVDH